MNRASNALIFLIFTSCAHTFMRGNVAKKLGPREAVVCLGQKEVKVGDLIKFEESVCSNSKVSSDTKMHELAEFSGIGRDSDFTGYDQGKCELIYLGKSKVIELINDHYSIVRTNSNFNFDNSTQVEIVH